MANSDKRIEYDVLFNTQKGLNDLTKVKEALESISRMDENSGGKYFGKNVSDYLSRMKTAKEEATKLETAMNKAFNPKLGTYNLTTLTKELKNQGTSIENIGNSFNSIGTTGRAAFTKVTGSIASQNTSLKTSSKLLKEMSTSMKNVVRYQINTRLFNAVVNELGAAVKYIKELDSSLNSIQIVTGNSTEQMANFALQANNAAKALGQTTVHYTDAALIFAQQGLGDSDIAERTETTLKMMNVLNESASTASENLTAIMNNFSDGTKSADEYIDVVSALGATTASSADEIATGISKFASVANTVGMSYEYATSAVATLVAATRQSADTVGTSMKTLLARMQDLEQGETLDDGVTLGSYSQALANVGVQVLDTSGNLRDLDDILDDTAAKWGNLSTAQQTALAQAVAGTRQYTYFTALMENWDKMQTNIQTAQNAEGTLDTQNEVYMQSLEAHINKLTAASEDLYDSLLDSDSFKVVLDLITSIVDGLGSFTDAIGGGGDVLATFGTILMRVFSGQITSGILQITNGIKSIGDKATESEDKINNLKEAYQAKGASTSAAKSIANFGVKNEQLHQGGIISQQQYENNNLKIKDFTDLAVQNEQNKTNRLSLNNYLNGLKGTTLGGFHKKDNTVNDFREKIEEGNSIARDYYGNITEEDFEKARTNWAQYAEDINKARERAAVSSKTGKMSPVNLAYMKENYRRAYSNASKLAKNGAIDNTHIVELLDRAKNGINQLEDGNGEWLNGNFNDKKNLRKNIGLLTKAFNNANQTSENQNRDTTTADVNTALKNLGSNIEITNGQFKTLQEVIPSVDTALAEMAEEASINADSEVAKNGYKTFKDLRKTGTLTENQFKDAQANLDTNTEEFDKQLNFSESVQGVANLAMGMTGLINLGQSFAYVFDEDATVMEKFTGVVTSLAFSLPMIAQGVSSLTTIPKIFSGIIGSISSFSKNVETYRTGLVALSGTMQALEVVTTALETETLTKTEADIGEALAIQYTNKSYEEEAVLSALNEKNHLAATVATFSHTVAEEGLGAAIKGVLPAIIAENLALIGIATVGIIAIAALRKYNEAQVENDKNIIQAAQDSQTLADSLKEVKSAYDEANEGFKNGTSSLDDYRNSIQDMADALDITIDTANMGVEALERLGEKYSKLIEQQEESNYLAQQNAMEAAEDLYEKENQGYKGDQKGGHDLGQQIKNKSEEKDTANSDLEDANSKKSEALADVQSKDSQAAYDMQKYSSLKDFLKNHEGELGEDVYDQVKAYYDAVQEAVDAQKKIDVINEWFTDEDNAETIDAYKEAAQNVIDNGIGSVSNDIKNGEKSSYNELVSSAASLRQGFYDIAKDGTADTEVANQVSLLLGDKYSAIAEALQMYTGDELESVIESIIANLQSGLDEIENTITNYQTASGQFKLDTIKESVSDKAAGESISKEDYDALVSSYEAAGLDISGAFAQVGEDQYQLLNDGQQIAQQLSEAYINAFGTIQQAATNFSQQYAEDLINRNMAEMTNQAEAAKKIFSTKSNTEQDNIAQGFGLSNGEEMSTMLDNAVQTGTIGKATVNMEDAYNYAQNGRILSDSFLKETGDLTQEYASSKMDDFIESTYGSEDALVNAMEQWQNFVNGVENGVFALEEEAQKAMANSAANMEELDNEREAGLLNDDNYAEGLETKASQYDNTEQEQRDLLDAQLARDNWRNTTGDDANYKKSDAALQDQVKPYDDKVNEAQNALDTSTRIGEIANSSGLSSDAMEAQLDTAKQKVDALNQSFTDSAELQARTAEELEESQQAFNDLTDNADDYKLVLRDIAKGNVAVAKGSKDWTNLKKSVAQLLNTSEDMADELLSNADNADLLTKAINGSTDAIEELEDAESEQAGQDLGLSDNSMDKVEDFRDSIDDLAAGADVDVSLGSDFLNNQGIQDAFTQLNNGSYTLDDITSKLESLTGVNLDWSQIVNPEGVTASVNGVKKSLTEMSDAELAAAGYAKVATDSLIANSNVEAEETDIQGSTESSQQAQGIDYDVKNNSYRVQYISDYKLGSTQTQDIGGSASTGQKTVKVQGATPIMGTKSFNFQTMVPKPGTETETKTEDKPNYTYYKLKKGSKGGGGSGVRRRAVRTRGGRGGGGGRRGRRRATSQSARITTSAGSPIAAGLTGSASLRVAASPAVSLTSTNIGTLNKRITDLVNGKVASAAKTKGSLLTSDPYFDVNRAITKLNATLEKLTTNADKLIGKAAIKNFKEQIANIRTTNQELKNQLDITSDQLENLRGKQTGNAADIAVAQAKQYEWKSGDNTVLKSGIATVSDDDYGFKFNDQGEITNYAEVIDIFSEEVNKLVTEYNEKYAEKSLSEDSDEGKMKKMLEEEIQTAQKNAESAATWAKEYLETLATSDEYKQSIRENLYTIIEDQIAEITADVKIDLDIQDAQATWKDFIETLNGARVDIALNLDGSIKEIQKNADNLIDYAINSKTTEKDIEKAINTVNKIIQKNSDGNSYLSSTVDDYKQLENWMSQVADDSTITDYLNSLGLSKDDIVKNQFIEWSDALQEFVVDETAAQEQLQTLEEDVTSAITTAVKDLDSIASYWSEELAQYTEAVEQILESYDDVNETLETQLSLIQLLEGESGVRARELMNEAYEKEIENYTKELQAYQQYADTLQNKLTEAETTFGINSEEYRELYSSWTDAVTSSTEALESALETLANKYENAIDKIFDETIENFASSINSANTTFDALEKDWEVSKTASDSYLDAVNTAYKLSSLQYKYTSAINSTSNTAAQKKLSNIMNEELNALKQMDKLSEYDVERAEKKYEIALKELELEEAQENKSTMRLRRDANGNYSYVYTADQDELSKLQDELATLKNELYNFDKDYITTVSEDAEKYYREWAEAAAEVYKDTTLTEEQRQQKLADLTDHYSTIINAKVAGYQEAQKNIVESAQDGIKDLLSDTSEAAATWADGFVNAIDLDDGLDYLQSDLSKFVEAFDSSGMDDTVDKLTKELEKYQKEVLDLNNAYNGSDKATASLAESTDDMLTKLDKVIDSLSTLQGTDLGELAKTVSDTMSSIASNFNNATKAVEGLSEALSQVNEASIAQGVDVSLTSSNLNSSNIAGAASGGYTGDWASGDGKLMFLHPEELILNKEETKSFFNFSNLLKDFLNGGNDFITTQLNNLSSLVNGYDVAKTVQDAISNFGIDNFEQTVNVNADFSGLDDARELKEVLTNISNAAIQYANSSEIKL